MKTSEIGGLVIGGLVDWWIPSPMTPGGLVIGDWWIGGLVD